MEVEEVTTPIRTQWPASVAQDALVRKHASGLLAFADEDVAQVLGTYRAASEQLDQQLQARLYDEHGRPRVMPEEAERQRARTAQEREKYLAKFRRRLDNLR